jgi:hypothetical protein
LDSAVGRFSEETLIAFVAGFQEVHELEMGELWALKPALQFTLLERIVSAATGDGSTLPELITSLRRVADADWKVIFEGMSVVDLVLSRDPAGAYSEMEYESRDMYRKVISDLAKQSRKPERLVAETAIAMASAADKQTCGIGRAAERRSHVGFYLVDLGLASLKTTLGYQPTFSQSVRTFVTRYPTPVYLLGIEITTMLIVYSLLEGLDNLTPVFAGFFLLLLPATHAAVGFMNNVVSSLVRPRVLAKLDFSKSIPAHCSTLVSVPTLLINDSQVRELVMDLEIRYLANRDPNLYFALITDSPDSDKASDEKDALVGVCAELIEELNQRYGTSGRTPFYMFHRYRTYNPAQGRWMGWERKRGKLIDLNELLRGGRDNFPIKVGDLSVLPKIRYVITLDSDTQLPRDSAHRLVGAIAHPLNRAVIDPATKMVVEGYGILQPRIGVSIQSASRSWLASIYSGQTGFDIYTRAISDVYQDLFGEGIFTGKGIYEVDAFRESLCQRFPDNALLSHDLIEGAFARAGLVSDIELIDDYPSHFSAYNRRKHRWMRGDWQILRWMLSRVPEYDGQMVANPINPISRWKIADNLRRSLFEPATLLLLISGWLYLPGAVYFWTAASLTMLLLPAYSGLLFSMIRAPWGRQTLLPWAKDTIKTFVRDHLVVLLHVTFLLYDAILAVDAIVRTTARVFFTRQRLLEWETAAESEANRRPKGAADKYLQWSPWMAVLITAIIWVVRPSALPVASAILVLWLFARVISYWLGLPPRAGKSGLKDDEVLLLKSSALRTWRFFAEFSSSDSNWLIPDNVLEDGTVANRLSPTNLGFLLNARIAAVHFGYLTVSEFVEQTRNTLETARQLPRFRGHFLNWYCVERLELLEPQFVSTVDSGNLAACLWTLKQAAISVARETPGYEVLWSGIQDIVRLIGSSNDSGAAALRDRILRSKADWKRDLPQLRDLALHFAETAEGEVSWWAKELVRRIEKAQAWIETGMTPETAAGLEEIADTADRLVNEMDFGFLYNPRKKVASVGFDVAAGRLEPSTYDLLASESRIASFVSIAKSDIPQESWFHLGRKHTLSRGQRVLMSWTGTMFEYLMPALWMKHYPRTIMQDSMQAAVRLQRRYARSKGVPWGISESGCADLDCGQFGYSAFGLPGLAMKRMDASRLVISPYSSFLALLVDPRAAIKNLRRMSKLGWTGRYGFYEAVDYSGGQVFTIQSWMAHHQGMILLSVCNVLFDNPFQRYFHAEPYVLATELLLHERVPTAVTADVDQMPEPLALVQESVA